MAELERAILQGVDAKPVSTYREDHRPDTPEPTTDDELGSDLSQEDDGLFDNDDEDDINESSGALTGNTDASGRGIKGMLASKTAARGEAGATNTGPKGVLRDQRLNMEEQRQSRLAAVQSANARMEKMAMSTETYFQQVEREKRQARAQLRNENADDDNDSVSKSAIADLRAKEQRRELRLSELKSSQHSNTTSHHQDPPHTAATNALTGSSSRWFGHLREVDERGYVSAIDNEDPQVPVVIHIYSKAVEECNVLTHSLSSLARLYPRTKFLQVQAAAIGFGSSRSAASPHLATINDTRRERGDFDDEESDDCDSHTLEVLPTLLVYKAGTLIANLVRVDLEEDWNGGEEQSVRNLLGKYRALVGDAAHTSNNTLSSSFDDEDDS